METELLDEFKDIKQLLIKLVATSNKTLFKQREVLDLYGIGHATLKQLIAEGLREIPVGNSIFYDIRELEELLATKKI